MINFVIFKFSLLHNLIFLPKHFYLIDQNGAEIVRFRRRAVRLLRLWFFFPDCFHRTRSLSGPLGRLSRLRTDGALNELKDDGGHAVVEMDADSKQEGQQAGVLQAKLLPVQGSRELKNCQKLKIHFLIMCKIKLW